MQTITLGLSLFVTYIFGGFHTLLLYLSNWNKLVRLAFACVAVFCEYIYLPYLEMPRVYKQILEHCTHSKR